MKTPNRGLFKYTAVCTTKDTILLEISEKDIENEVKFYEVLVKKA